MKIIAAIEADFERGALGTRSRLRDVLLGETVLRRTLKRVLAARRIGGVHLIVETGQQGFAREAAIGLPVQVEAHAGGPPPWQAYIASARKWALDAWRGGVGGATFFDESFNPWMLEALARREKADGVVAVPAGAALIDPTLLDHLITHFEKVSDQVRMVFTQSPPGLSAAVYTPSLLADMAQTVQPPGRVMSYRPSDPQRDMIMQPCYYAVEAAVAHAAGRLIVDTSEAFRRVEAILKAVICRESAADCLDAARVTRFLNEISGPALPAEVEIELTTDDPLPATTLRPRGCAVGRRGPVDEELFARLVDEVVARDDVRIVLGGFGDPLLHPKWPMLAARCRAAGVLGLAVRTPAVHLDERAVELLIEHQVDVLNVLIDAATAETYARVHRADLFDRVRTNIERVFEAHQKSKQPRPLVVCEMMKTRETMAEMEAFYDHWINKAGAAVISGPVSYAGRWTDLAVMRMAPPARFPCGRVSSRAMVLADGRMTVCDQDFRGEHAIGSLADSSFSHLWMSDVMHAVRGAEQAGTHEGMPLCRDCQEWHRP